MSGNTGNKSHSTKFYSFLRKLAPDLTSFNKVLGEEIRKEDLITV
jgi:hypothetical protein